MVWYVVSEMEVDFGLVFPTEASASLFSRHLISRLCLGYFHEICRATCHLGVFDRLATTWNDVETAAVAQIREKSNCTEAYILVFPQNAGTHSGGSSSSSSSPLTASGSSTGSSKNIAVAKEKENSNTRSTNKKEIAKAKVASGAASAPASAVAAETAAASDGGFAAVTAALEAAEEADLAAGEAAVAVAAAAAPAPTELPLCYIRICQEEFLVSLREQRELQWWGTSPDGEKRLYRITFVATANQQQEQQTEDDEGQKFLDMFSLTLAQVTNKCRFSLDVDLDKQIGYLGAFDSSPAGQTPQTTNHTLQETVTRPGISSGKLLALLPIGRQNFFRCQYKQRPVRLKRMI